MYIHWFCHMLYVIICHSILLPGWDLGARHLLDRKNKEIRVLGKQNVTNRVCQWSITNHLPGHPIGQHWPQPPLDWNALSWVNVGTMVTDVWSPTPTPTNSPQPASPKIPTITLPSHTTWPCNQHTTQLSICFVIHYCKGTNSYSNCSFHLTPPSKEWDPFGENPIYCLSYLLSNQGDWTEFPYRLHMLVGYWRVLSVCEPWQTLPQDHPKGLVHGTLLPSAVTRTHFTSHSLHKCNYMY